LSKILYRFTGYKDYDGRLIKDWEENPELEDLEEEEIPNLIVRQPFQSLGGCVGDFMQYRGDVNYSTTLKRFRFDKTNVRVELEPNEFEVLEVKPFLLENFL